VRELDALLVERTAEPTKQMMDAARTRWLAEPERADVRLT